MRIGLASRNADEVLAAAGVADLFDEKVDGRDATELQLPGKPDPAMYLEAARRLGVDRPRPPCGGRDSHRCPQFHGRQRS